MAAVRKTLLPFIVTATAVALCHGVAGAATPAPSDDTYNGDNAVVDGGPVVADSPPTPSYPQPPEPRDYASDNVNDANSDVKEPVEYNNANVASDVPKEHQTDGNVYNSRSDVKEPPQYDKDNVKSDVHNTDGNVNDAKGDVKESVQYDNSNVEYDGPNVYNTDGNVSDAKGDVRDSAQYDNANVKYDDPNVHKTDDNVNDSNNVNGSTQYGNESDGRQVDNAEVNNAFTDVNDNRVDGNDDVGGANVNEYTRQSSSSNSDDGTPVNNKKCSFSLVQKSKFDPRVDRLNTTILDKMEAAFKNSPLAIQIFGKYLDPGSAGKSGSFASPQSGIPPIGSNPGISPIKANPGLSLDSPFGSAGTHRPSSRTIKVNPSHAAFNVNQMFNQISGDATGFSHPISKFKGIGNPPGNFGLKPAFIGGGGRRNGGRIQGDFFSNFGNFFRRRRKRMAVPPSPEVFNGAKKPKAVCPPNRSLVTGFLKNGNLCYLYKAAVQGIETDACQQKECNACADAGPAQCMPEDLSSWVWAWCPTQGPGDILTYEYIEYPAYCSCKAIEC